MKRLIALLVACEARAAGIFLAVSVFLVTAQLFMRLVLKMGIGGIYELAIFCAVWSIFLCAGTGIRHGTHVRVDLLLHIASPRVAWVMELIIAMVVTVVSAALMITGWMLMQESWYFGEYSTGTLSLPMWLVHSAIPLGGAMMVVNSLINIVRLFRPAPARTAESPQEAINIT